MTGKEQFIKAAFKNYRKNKKRLSEMRFDNLRAVDYTRKKAKSKCGGFEDALAAFIDEKIAIEKAVELVDRTLYHYEVIERAHADGKALYIRCRFLQGMSFARAGIECGVGDSTATNWLKDIRETAAAVADLYALWVK